MYCSKYFDGLETSKNARRQKGLGKPTENILLANNRKRNTNSKNGSASRCKIIASISKLIRTNGVTTKNEMCLKSKQIEFPMLSLKSTRSEVM